MKTLRHLLLLFPLLVQGLGYSQVNDFKLSDYKLPDLDRKLLETNFNFSASNNYYIMPPGSYYNQSSSNSFYNNFYSRYSHFLNNENMQRETNAGLNLYANFYNNKYNKQLSSKSSDISSSLYFQRHNRIYKLNDFYFEPDVYASYQYERGYSYYSGAFNGTETKDLIQTHAFLVQIPLKLGEGRIEQVQDARQAVYLFDHLKEIDRVTPAKSSNEIIDFARLISSLWNKRFFDSRIRRMEEIEAVDSFLTAKNYVLNPDAKYYTTLGDYWDYGNRPVRYSGKRIAIVILPGYYYYHYQYPGNQLYRFQGTYMINAFMVNGGIEFTKEKPINLYWQNSVNVTGYIGTIEGKLNDITNDNKQTLRIPNLQLNFFNTVGFYPNTRTNMSFGYSLQYIQLFDNTNAAEKIIGMDGKGAKASVNLSINYYISPKFRLNLSSALYYIWEDSNNRAILNFENLEGSNYLLNNYVDNPYTTYGDFMEKQINYFASISLIYSIF